MASKKISELNSAASLTGAETFLIVQSGDNRKLTLDSLLGNMTTTVSVNPTLTLTTNSYIVKATGGSTANGVFKITGNATQPTLTLNNTTADNKFVFNIGALNTIGGTSYQQTETWNAAGLTFNSMNITISTSPSAASASRIYKATVGSSEVWGVSTDGNMYVGNAMYSKFGTFGFIGTYNGFTVASGTSVTVTSAGKAFSAAEMRAHSHIFINASSASTTLEHSLPSMADDDSGKIWIIHINQNANSQSVIPVNSGERGQRYFRVRTEATTGVYTQWWFWSKIDGTGKWYNWVPGSSYNTGNNAPTAPTGTNNAGWAFNLCAA
jgi:hypothetical protein